MHLVLASSSVRRATLGRRAGLVALLALLMLALPRPLLAHTHLVKSAPAAKSRLAAPPDAIRLWFSEAPEVAFTRVVLMGPAGNTIATGKVTQDPANHLLLSVAIPTTLAPGQYTVSWSTAAADGHPSRGTFTFTVLGGATATSPPAAPAGTQAGAPPASGATGAASPSAASGQQGAPGVTTPASTTTSTPAAFDTSSPLYVLVRAVSFVALLALLGVVAFHLLVLGTLRRTAALNGSTLDRASVRAARLGVIAAVALLVATVARLYAESYAVYGATGDPGMAQIRAMLGQTVWGLGWIIQAAATLVALVLFIAATRRNATAAWMLAALAVFVLAFTPALSGHAAASPHEKPLAIAIDGLHVLGAGGWLGTLLVVMAVGIPVALGLGAQRGRAIADVVNAFSPLALTFAGLTAATGIINAWLRLGTLPALWESSYGRTLIVKLVVLSLVVATGAYNWRRVRPSLGDEAGTLRIRRSASVELIIGLVVVIVTAVLVAPPPP
ncbi:MAG TPA: copper resistance protein CopC [Gemmatimonadaceae bacterium]|nr:copper resistance protein CopC [Gemmatimonadaceae bacterium]